MIARLLRMLARPHRHRFGGDWVEPGNVRCPVCGAHLEGQEEETRG